MNTIFQLVSVIPGKREVICENSDYTTVENAANTRIHQIQYCDEKPSKLYINKLVNGHLQSIKKIPYSR